MKITVETTISAPIGAVWDAYVTPEDIVHWNAASDDWHTTKSTVDLRAGGKFSSRMEAKDGSFGFDFEGKYSRIVPHDRIDKALSNSCQSKTAFVCGQRLTRKRSIRSSSSVTAGRQSWIASPGTFTQNHP
jgi:uncharacterized protein YndB with AHSA1/START domain